MPTYEYECMNPHCKEVVSQTRPISEREQPYPADCPKCFTKVKFVLSATPGRVVGGTPRHYR